MRRNGWKVVLAVVVAGALLFAAQVLATPASGFSATTLALGRFGQIDVKNRLGAPDDDDGGGLGGEDDDRGGPGGEDDHGRGGRDRGGDDRDIWRSVQRTRGESDLYVQSNVWQPGGSTGWHTHPGHSLITVTQGSVTVYEANDRNCRPHVYQAGDGFVDEGGDHVHLIRNEGPGEARTVAVQLIPRGAARRVDAPSPMTCPF